MNDPNRTSVGARLSCQSCGETIELAGGLGSVATLRFEHEEDCAFLKAIESGRGCEWVKAHGDPIRVETT